ncbi:MAG: hypothetical protein C0399_02135 [Syntrophus sp. (in: bacteria)]|nr:hypothetical protein [Syntrophus sp. (in: bacteria)]
MLHAAIAGILILGSGFEALDNPTDILLFLKKKSFLQPVFLHQERLVGAFCIFYKFITAFYI